MKKILSITALLLVFTLALTACNLDVDITAQAEPQIREMLNALTAGDGEAAEAQLHPSRADGATDAAIAAMIDLLGGREVESCTQVSLHVNTSAGTKGTARTESGTVHLLFTDGTDLRLQYAYVSDNNGQGFATFEFLVGV